MQNSSGGKRDSQRDVREESSPQALDQPFGSAEFSVSERFFLDLIGVLSWCLCVSLFVALGLRSVSAEGFALGSCLVLIVCIGCLAAAAAFNDFLIADKGFNSLVAISSVGICLGSVLLVVHPFFCCLIAVGCISLALLWTNFLVVQKHYFLNVILLCASLLAGSAFLFVLAVDDSYALVVLAVVFGAVSIVCAYISKSHYKTTITSFLSHEESRTNARTRKSNFSKIFAEGFVLGISLILTNVSFDRTGTDPLFMGAILIAAAIVSCLLRYIPNLSYENFMNWHMVLIYAIAFLSYPLMNDFLKLAVSCVAFFFSVCFVLILVAAMSEFAKTVKISCFYEFGREGAMYFVGMLCGLALTWLMEYHLLDVSAGVAESAMCSIAVIVLVWLNIDIVKGGYPHPEEFGTAKEQRIAPRHGASWKAKVNYAAQVYSLSPRQKEVLLLLARGRNAHYIMNELCVSNATVKSHVYSVYRKMGVHTQQELIDKIEEIELNQ